MIQVASSDQGFAFTPTDAVYHYHSIYDSQRFQEIYADPGFYRHVGSFARIDKLHTDFTWIVGRCSEASRITGSPPHGLHHCSSQYYALLIGAWKLPR